MDKTLGQIAFEAAESTGLRWNVSWADAFGKSDWDAIAAAVAAAVKEEDARICDQLANDPAWLDRFRDGAAESAAAIRASIKEVK